MGAISFGTTIAEKKLAVAMRLNMKESNDILDKLCEIVTEEELRRALESLFFETVNRRKEMGIKLGRFLRMEDSVYAEIHHSKSFFLVKALTNLRKN